MASSETASLSNLSLVARIAGEAPGNRSSRTRGCRRKRAHAARTIMSWSAICRCMASGSARTKSSTSMRFIGWCWMRGDCEPRLGCGSRLAVSGIMGRLNAGRNSFDCFAPYFSRRIRSFRSLITTKHSFHPSIEFAFNIWCILAMRLRRLGSRNRTRMMPGCVPGLNFRMSEKSKSWVNSIRFSLTAA